MKPLPEPAPLDRYTTMGDLTDNVRRILKRGLFITGVVMAVETAYLVFSGNPGALSFALMAAGSMIALSIWSSDAIGVPLLPMMVVQQLVINALPIVSRHEVLAAYPPEFLTRAGLEVLVFQVALAVAWRLGIQVLQPSSAEAYALEGVDRKGVAGLARLGFGFAGAATAFLILQSLGLADFVLQLLPNGSYPIVVAAVAASSACGFFLLAMIVGSGEMPSVPRILFWVLMAANCLISASSLLLSSALVVISSVVIGLFWSTGRIPWRFMIFVAVAVSFFNSGKYAMRGRYWQTAEDETPSAFNLLQMPSFYAEWTRAGFDSLTGGKSEDYEQLTKKDPTKRGEQTLLDRLNNLQNLLYVIDATETWHINPLYGDTYSLIPPLLIPRFLWPGKPRTHEGQIMLNVHFGRQQLESTLKTYVAWGLLAEAYGNFGAIKGAIFLGVVLGVFFAWAENYTTRKPLLSIEGFVAFAVFLGLANSYEAVASVMITAIFQSLFPIVAACAPFVRRMTVARPAPE